MFSRKKPKTITENDIKNLLNPLPRHYCVKFALYCCNDTKDHITDPASIKAVALTQLWLDSNDTAVTDEELTKAAASTTIRRTGGAAVISSAAASTAAYAAYTAASAADYAAYAAYAAASAADYAAYAAASAAAYNVVKDRDVKMKQYYDHLCAMINDMTELEKMLYGVDL